MPERERREEVSVVGARASRAGCATEEEEEETEKEGGWIRRFGTVVPRHTTGEAAAAAK